MNSINQSIKTELVLALSLVDHIKKTPIETHNGIPMMAAPPEDIRKAVCNIPFSIAGMLEELALLIEIEILIASRNEKFQKLVDLKKNKV